MYWNQPKVEVIQLSREDLYEKVGSEPTRTLALKYGLSDVGLAKICKNFKFPRPGLGFWAKKGHGKKVRKTPLRDTTALLRGNGRDRRFREAGYPWKGVSGHPGEEVFDTAQFTSDGFYPGGVQDPGI